MNRYFVFINYFFICITFLKSELIQINDNTMISEGVFYKDETTANRIFSKNNLNDYTPSHFFMIDSLVSESKVIINDNDEIYTVYSKRFPDLGLSKGYAQKYNIQGAPYWEQPIEIFRNLFFDFEVHSGKMYVLWNDRIFTISSS